MARYPKIGRARDNDLGLGLRSLLAGDYVIIYRIESEDLVLILHIMPGSRDIAALL